MLTLNVVPSSLLLHLHILLLVLQSWGPFSPSGRLHQNIAALGDSFRARSSVCPSRSTSQPLHPVLCPRKWVPWTRPFTPQYWILPMVSFDSTLTFTNSLLQKLKPPQILSWIWHLPSALILFHSFVYSQALLIALSLIEHIKGCLELIAIFLCD